MKRLALVLFAVVALSACGVTVTTQTRQQIDTADRIAFSGLSAYQQTEEALWHAKAAWPSASQHAANGAVLSKAFSLVAAVAQAGIDLKAGQPLSASVQQELADLTATLSTLVAQSVAGPAQIQAQAADAQSQGAVLTSAVLKKAN